MVQRMALGKSCEHSTVFTIYSIGVSGILSISFLNDLRAIPFAIVCASLGWQIIHLLTSGLLYLVKRTRNGETPVSDGAADHSQLPGFLHKFKRHVTYFGGYTIVGFMLARLLGSTALVILSRRTLQTTCDTTSPAKCPEAFLTITFVSDLRNSVL